MKTYQQLEENPLFERTDCLVCGNADVDSVLTIPYGRLKQKKSLDYSHIGIDTDTIMNVDRCPRCGFVYANPRIKVEYESKIYNENNQGLHAKMASAEGTPEYQASLTRRRLGYLPTLLRAIALVDPTADRSSPITMLDVGCGFGHTLALARELGLEGYGTDISRDSLEYCRKQGLQVYEPQAFDEQYPDLKFDIIITQSILEHAVDLNAFMSWVAGRARQGTILYVNGLTPELIDAERKINSFVKAHFVEHINYFTPGALRAFMRGHGFTEVDREVVMVNARGVRVPRILISAARKVMRRGAIKVFSKYYGYGAGTS